MWDCGKINSVLKKNKAYNKICCAVILLFIHEMHISMSCFSAIPHPVGGFIG